MKKKKKKKDSLPKLLELSFIVGEVLVLLTGPHVLVDWRKQD